jgi:cyclic pyranopterin phosphate synthase
VDNKMSNFTHIDEKNNPTMVDVSDKLVTKRMAHARCYMHLPQEVLEKVSGDEIQSKKGPVFHTAIIAATMAAKKTQDLIPFCHQINLESIKVNIGIENEKVVINAKVVTTSKTGVEMEALVAVNTAALTIYDMCKAFSQKMIIEKSFLVEKSGGKSDIKNQDLD